MKYTVAIEINQPLEKTVALFDNEENIYKWMEGLQHFEHLTGEPGTPGATSKMVFKMKNREMEMIETVEEKNLPDFYRMNYKAKGVLNIINNKFEAIDEATTRYTTEQEFKFKGAMKVIGFLMPGAFKKQSMKYLKDFKAFAESC